ncbi:MAG: radical SAM family heme chaperone HemW, partial [Candidatus Sumerlaeaceae bacterium]
MAQFLYIHVPFCEARCPYCDFFTLGKGAQAQELANAWLELAGRELELWIEAGDVSPSDPVATIYFGGGTPSLLSGQAMRRFLDQVGRHVTFAPDIEVTVEMQPRTADLEKLRSYAEAGVNRFSIGAQTFSSELLALLERRHSVADTVELIRDAQRFGRVSIDLIAALPGQTLEQWQEDLETALSFSPVHLSIYELTYYPDTRLRTWLEEGRVHQADEDLRLAILDWTIEHLTSAGYEHYEISNFAKPGLRSRHNENYWRLGNYVGLGAGAHSFIFPHRYVNPPDVNAYSKIVRAGQLARQLADARDENIFL